MIIRPCKICGDYPQRDKDYSNRGGVRMMCANFKCTAHTRRWETNDEALTEWNEMNDPEPKPVNEGEAAASIEKTGQNNHLLSNVHFGDRAFSLREGHVIIGDVLDPPNSNGKMLNTYIAEGGRNYDEHGYEMYADSDDTDEIPGLFPSLKACIEYLEKTYG